MTFLKHYINLIPTKYIQIITQQNSLFQYVKSQNPSPDYVYIKPSFYGDIWETLQQTLNFSYTMVPVLSVYNDNSISVKVYSTDGGWGNKVAEGKFSGIVDKIWKLHKCFYNSLQIGMVHRGEVDVGVTSFFANKERAEVVDFSPVLGYAKLDNSTL